MAKVRIFILQILFIIFAIMSLILGDAKQRVAGERLAPSDSVGSQQLLPLTDEWVNLDASLFSYNSGTSINISEDLRHKIRKGTFLKVMQVGSSSYKYHLVSSNTGALITTVPAGGTLADFTNNDFEEVYFSNETVPQGFAYINTSLPVTPSGSMTLTIGTATAYINFNNYLNIVDINIGDTIGGTPSNQLDIAVPFAGISNQSILVDILNNGTRVTGRAQVILGGSTSTIRITKQDGSNFQAGGITIAFTIIY